MKETVSSLQKNVETFVQNRRGEGGQLLSRIEQSKSQGADQEQQRLKDLMDRMSMEPSNSGSPVQMAGGRKKSVPPPLSSSAGYRPPSSTGAGGHPSYNPATSPPVTPRYPMTTASSQQPYMSPQQSYGAPSNGYQQPPPPRRESYQSFSAQAPTHQSQNSQSSAYNPAQHSQYNPVSPPAHQQFFSPPPPQQQQQHQPWGQPPQQQQQWGAPQQSSLPQGYVPPPPPPGPPPNQNMDYSHFTQGNYPSGPGGYAQPQRQQQQGQGQGQGQHDPWAGLSGWK
jgi:hypothetical protein